MLLLLGALLKATKLSDLLLGECIDTLQVCFELAHLLLFLGNFLLFLLEVLAHGLLELEEPILVKLLCSFNVLFLLLLLLQISLQSLDSCLLHRDLLGNRIFFLLPLANLLCQFLVQSLQLLSMLFLDGLHSLRVILGSSQALPTIGLGLLLFSLE